MTTPFLSGATGDPVNLQRQIIAQPTRGVPVDLPESDSAPTWRDFRSDGGPVVFSPQEIERLVIAAGGQPQGNLPGKINIEDITFEIGDVDPANFGMLNMLANLMTKYDNTDLTTYRRWDFALDGGTSADPFCSYREWNDVLPGFRLTDLLIGGAALTVAPNDNLKIDFNAIAGEFDFHGAVTQEVGSGSDLPALKRFWGAYAAATGNFAPDATDQDLYIQIDQNTDIDISAKVASGSAYSNTQLDELLGEWHRLFDESGGKLGLFAEQVRYRFPSAATLVATDEFKILKRMAKWTPSLAADRPITSVNTLFRLDGVEIQTEGGWEISIERETTELRPDVAGKQGGTVRKSGDLVAVITPTREAVDLTLQEAILAASEVSVVIHAETDVLIPTSTVPFRFLAVFPQCRAFGSTFGVDAGGQNRDETVRLVAEEPDAAFNYDGLTFNAHAHIVVENDIADL